MRARRRAPRSTTAFPPAPVPAGRVLDARLHLLDRQVLDVVGVPVTTVDDVALEAIEGDGAAPEGPVGRTHVVGALLAGPALVTRIVGGRVPSSRMHRIPWSAVTEVGVSVRIGLRGDDLTVTWTERWVRDQIIRHIPGGRHDPE